MTRDEATTIVETLESFNINTTTYHLTGVNEWQVIRGDERVFVIQNDLIESLINIDTDNVIQKRKKGTPKPI